MPYFEYYQNNSGGGFDSNEELAARVYIEADNLEEANIKAKSIGIYFNGVEEERDCPCCGDRWHEPWEALEFPMAYGKETFQNLDEYLTHLVKEYGGWTSPNTIVHHKDGSKTTYG